MENNDLLKSLETYDKKYKRFEIDEVLIKREEITPYLISVLENVLQDPEKYADRDSDYWGHIYAFMLLGHFCETKVCFRQACVKKKISWCMVSFLQAWVGATNLYESVCGAAEVCTACSVQTTASPPVKQGV